MKGEKLYIKAELVLDQLYAQSKLLSIDEKKILYSEYMKLLKISAYKGFPDAQYGLAQHYDNIGFWGVPNPYYNVYKKFYWYSKAVSNDHAAAHNSLADMYERGEGCTKDIRKALKLYKKSAELGDVYGKKNYFLFKKQLKKAGLLDWATDGVDPPQLEKLLKQLYNS